MDQRARAAYHRGRAAVLHNRLRRAIRLRHAVTQPYRFALVEGVLRHGRPQAWKLRSGVGQVVLRSGGRDLDIFEEIFGAGEYDPPAAVLEVLAGIEHPRIVDLGGNIGLFAMRILEQVDDCKIVSFEPDPANLEILEQARASVADPQRWTLIPAAAGVADGTATFMSGQEADSRMVSGGPGTIEVPVVDIFEHLGKCDFLKIDIEGGEWPILLDERFANVPARVVALEFHGYQRPSDDIRAAASAALEQHGFRVRHVGWHPIGVGRLWAWRGGLLP